MSVSRRSDEEEQFLKSISLTYFFKTDRQKPVGLLYNINQLTILSFGGELWQQGLQQAKK